MNVENAKTIFPGPLETTIVVPKTNSSGATVFFGSIDASDYTDEQFIDDLNRASKPLSALADKARESLKNGTALKFPV